MEFREFSAKTVDEAITKASLEFETFSENLEIEVISEGKSGFLGFGAKPAIIKVRKKEASEQLETPVEEEKKEEAAAQEIPKTARKETVKEQKREVKKETEQPKEERKVVERSPEEVAEMKAEAEKFLGGVFKAMELEVEIKMDYKAEEGNLDIEFVGHDMGILIGKRGQTLDSLQYLTSLVVNKGRQGYVRVKLDTEDYRNRRKETLENLARSIAYKVRKTRKTVSLEPMNPYERRIIHSALQGNRYVETYSEGNEPYRHVVVKLKNR
nr:RNA-binding cell elongation regulator Jag/EloR [uncultured Blautia sp.]